MTNVNLLICASLVAILVIGWLAFKDVPRIVWVLRKGRRTKGHIVRDHAIVLGQGTIYFPVFTFRDEAGILYEITSRYQKQTSAREQMTEVEIAYDPGAPAKSAILVGFRFYWPTVLMAGCFIVIAVIIATAAYSISR